jgi:hypothetical protein
MKLWDENLKLLDLVGLVDESIGTHLIGNISVGSWPGPSVRDWDIVGS